MIFSYLFLPISMLEEPLKCIITWLFSLLKSEIKFYLVRYLVGQHTVIVYKNCCGGNENDKRYCRVWGSNYHLNTICPRLYLKNREMIF